MPIFEIAGPILQRLARTTLADASLRERNDLQRLLRAHLPEVAPDLLVISEEFGHWDESKRRIDLLAIDRQANLVVIELKRGDTGSHMELQAVRYAAMVSKMTFEQALDTYQQHTKDVDAFDARSYMLDFLGWDAPSEEHFGQDVRILLFSEDYSRELTSSVLWLNEKGLDITAFRMSAYTLGTQILIDFQQIIPLKEAEDYQVQVRNKQQVEQVARRARLPWNNEYYANYAGTERSWSEAVKYGFISAGGSSWYTRTLGILEPGGRVWVNRPGQGYLGVGIIESGPIPASEFLVETDKGPTRFLDLSRHRDSLLASTKDKETEEQFVRVRWLKTVPENGAVRELGFFGNQNSAAKPVTEAWEMTVQRLKVLFGVAD